MLISNFISLNNNDFEHVFIDHSFYDTSYDLINHYICCLIIKGAFQKHLWALKSKIS